MQSVLVVRKAFLSALVALTVLAGAMFIATPSASAAASDCPSGWVCLFDGVEWSGRMLRFTDSGEWQNLSAWGFNDQTTSVYNKTNRDAKLSYHANGEGGHHCIQPGQAIALLPAVWNNNASAIKVFASAAAC